MNKTIPIEKKETYKGFTIYRESKTEYIVVRDRLIIGKNFPSVDDAKNYINSLPESENV